MKELTKEDLKMGSIWLDIEYEGWRVKIETIEDRIVTCLVIDGPDKSILGSYEAYLINNFLNYFLPVYTVEGFEV